MKPTEGVALLLHADLKQYLYVGVRLARQVFLYTVEQRRTLPHKQTHNAQGEVQAERDKKTADPDRARRETQGGASLVSHVLFTVCKRWLSFGTPEV